MFPEVCIISIYEKLFTWNSGGGRDEIQFEDFILEINVKN